MSWTYGIQAAEAALREDPSEVREVWIVRGGREGSARARVRALARAAGVRCREVADEQLRGAVGDVVHQGVAVRLTEFSYADPEGLWAPADRERSLLVVLDRVQDPRNLGAVLRTAQAFGADGVVIPRHRAVGVTAAARKVAAGAAAVLPVARVTNLARYVEEAQRRGYWVYGAVAHGGESLRSVELSDRAVLVFGAESDGVREKLEERCDVRVTLGARGLESLNVSVAAGIFIWWWAEGMNSA